MYTFGNPLYSPFNNTFYKVPIANTSPTQHVNVYPVNTVDYVWPQVPIVSYMATIRATPLSYSQRQPNIWYPAVSKRPHVPALQVKRTDHLILAQFIA